MAIKYDYYKAKIETTKTIGLISGVGESPHGVQTTVEKLIETCNVIVFLNPGYKNYIYQELFYNTKDLAKVFLDSIKDLNLSDFYLAGQCMGSIIAQEMAILEPKLIKKIILISAHYGSYHRLEHHKYLKYDLKYTTLEQYLFTEEFIKNNPVIVKEVNDDLKIHRLSKGNLIGQAHCGYSSTTMQRLKNIKQNTLIINGNEDNTVNPIFPKKLAKAIMKSKLIMLDKVGHSPLIEAPQIITDILEFINSKEEFTAKDVSNIFSKEEIAKDNQFLEDIKTYERALKIKNLFGKCDNEDLNKALEKLKNND